MPVISHNDWLEHAMKAKENTDIDRFNAVDKTLADFLDKVGWYDSLHDIQELLKAMKFRSQSKVSTILLPSHAY